MTNHAQRERATTTRRGVIKAGAGAGLAVAGLAGAASPIAASPLTRPHLGGLHQGADSGLFTALLARSLPDLDPHSAYDGVASSVIVAAYETLVRLKGESTFDYEPGLAESWTASADGSSWTFTLFPNVLFHDGTPCNAEAVVASFRRFLEMGGGPVDVLARFVASPDDIVASGELDVTFTLKTPSDLFLAAMASQYGPFVVSPAAVEANATEEDPFAHEWFLSNMAGTGPYRLVENDPSNQVVFEAFPDYYRGWDGSHFTSVVFRVVPEEATRRSLLESGDADALVNSLSPENKDALAGNADLQVIESASTSVEWATLNAGAQLVDPRARQGLSYAFPYDEVRNGVMVGLYETTGGPLAPSVRGYDPDVFIYQTDLAKAKELLDATVEPGTTFSWSIAANNDQSAAIAQLFQANLQSIGYDLAINAIDRGAQIDMAYGVTEPAEKPDAIGDWAWFPDYNDAYNQLAPNFGTEAGSNIGFYSNARVDEILATLSGGADEATYTALTKEAVNILTEQDPPCIYFGARRVFYVLGAGIQGFQFNPIYLESYNLYGMSRAS